MSAKQIVGTRNNNDLFDIFLYWLLDHDACLPYTLELHADEKKSGNGLLGSCNYEWSAKNNCQKRISLSTRETLNYLKLT